MKTRSFGCTTIIFVVLLGIGVFWLMQTLGGMQQAEESSAWLSTTGKIVDTWIDHERDTDPDGDSQDSYKPHLEYAYQVNGKNFSSRRVDFGAQPSYSSLSRAKDYLANYPVNSEVPVFYAPDDPSESVLVREARGAAGSLIGSGAMILISVVGWFGALVKRVRSNRSTPPEDFKG